MLLDAGKRHNNMNRCLGTVNFNSKMAQWHLHTDFRVNFGFALKYVYSILNVLEIYNNVFKN